MQITKIQIWTESVIMHVVKDSRQLEVVLHPMLCIFLSKYLPHIFKHLPPFLDEFLGNSSELCYNFVTKIKLMAFSILVKYYQV